MNIKDLDDAAAAESRVLAGLSYGSVPTEPNMVLTLDPAWRTHDDYLNSLTSKYRGDIKNRVFKKFNESGATIELITDVASHAETLQRMYLDVQSNATLRPFTLPSAYWPGLASLGAGNVAIHETPSSIPQSASAAAVALHRERGTARIHAVQGSAE